MKKPALRPYVEFAHADPSGAIYRTTFIWDRKCTKRELTRWISEYCRTIEPGGVRGYVTEVLGYTPYPTRAWLRRGRKVLAEWPTGVAVMPRVA